MGRRMEQGGKEGSRGGQGLLLLWWGVRYWCWCGRVEEGIDEAGGEAGGDQIGLDGANLMPDLTCGDTPMGVGLGLEPCCFRVTVWSVHAVVCITCRDKCRTRSA